MKSPSVWIALIALLAAAAGGAYWWRVAGAPEPPPVVAAAPAPAPPAPPAIAFPVPAPPPGAAALPPVADSDALLDETARALFGRDAFLRYFYPDGMVRRFVATIDNLPRRTAAQRLMPVRPVPGAFTVIGGDGTFAAAPANALRYRPYVVAMEAVEATRLVAAYVRLYPLFQAAYQELGYPHGYFNDRLVQALDDLIAAPDPAAPALVQPKVLYELADADLEQRSAGQKIMLRMGNANAARVKDKLRAIRRELIGQPPPH